jgi:plastocyanin
MVSAPRALLAILLLLIVALAGCTGGDKAANRPPSAELVAAATAEDPAVWLLDASASTDPDGDPLTYHWNWVLGNAATIVPKVEVEFPAQVAGGNANFFATVVVRDGRGGADFAGAALVFGTGANKAPKIELRPTPRHVAPGVEVVLDAGRTADPDGDALAYQWYWGPRANYDPNRHGVEDACALEDRTLAVFTTGCLDEGESWDLTFEHGGTFTLHCHPHPWMKGVLVVDPSLPASDRDYVIRDFAMPALVRVGVGSTVRFVNQDPVPHSATVEDYIPGTSDGGTEPVFRHAFGEGEYVVRLVVEDGKGGRATQTWGVKAGADAPANPFVKEYESEQPLLPGGRWSKGYYNVSFETDVTAELTWSDPSPSGAFVGNFSVGRIGSSGTYNPQSHCVARPEPGLAGEPPLVRMTCTLKADDYVFVVESGRDGQPSSLPNWTLTISGIVKSTPGFGDAGGGHEHGGHDH